MTAVGVTSKFSSYLFDIIFTDGIDLTYQEAMQDFEIELALQGIEKGSDEFEDRLAEFSDTYENDSSFYLFGAWVKNSEGTYEIDRTGNSGDFAATYSNSNGDIVCIEWSKRAVLCNETSPCYVMADGSGPCGDLDAAGDSVLAYALPEEFAAENNF